MNDKAKLNLIQQLIDNHYEFLSSADDAKNSASLEATIDAISVILSYEDDSGETCSCCTCGSAEA